MATKAYRYLAEASICFTVVAESAEEADRKAAEMVRVGGHGEDVSGPGNDAVMYYDNGTIPERMGEADSEES